MRPGEASRGKGGNGVAPSGSAPSWGVEQRGRGGLPRYLQVPRPRAEDALAVRQHAHLEGPERGQRRPGVAHALEREAGVAPGVLQQNLHASGVLEGTKSAFALVRPPSLRGSTTSTDALRRSAYLVEHGGDVVDAVEHDDPAVGRRVVERHHVQGDHALALRHPVEERTTIVSASV